MTPRPRNRKNQSLPPNLYFKNRGKHSYYHYKHPETGKFHAIGNDKNKAIAAANQLNSILIKPVDLVAEVLGENTLSDHIDWFYKSVIPSRDYARATLEIYEIRSRMLREHYGDHLLADITVKDISDLMEMLTPRPAQQLRQVATDIFKTAMGRGLIEVNPAEMTNKPVVRKSRKRLSQEQYDLIFKSAPRWLQNAMSIALYTIQRREDIVMMRFDNIKNGELYIIQEKTKKHDTGYLLIEIGEPLSRAISKCRDEIVSPYLIHRRPAKKISRKGCDHWTQISKEMVTRKFTEIVDSLDVFESTPKEQRPTFHEIRALGERMYKKAGLNPQKIGGWASEKMMRNYESCHDDILWVRTKSL